MRRNAKFLEVGMNDYIRAYRKIACSKAYERVWAGKTARVFEAYADTIAQTIAADIMRGEWGGTYYMDGRPLNTDDPELYAVGGAVHKTEIPLDAGEAEVYTEVLAACELLREVIVDLQSDGMGDVYIGFWRTDERGDDPVYCFDVSNAIRGEEQAKALGRERGEDAIYHFATDTEIRCARRSAGSKQNYGKGWVDFKSRNSEWYKER